MAAFLSQTPATEEEKNPFTKKTIVDCGYITMLKKSVSHFYVNTPTD